MLEMISVLEELYDIKQFASIQKLFSRAHYDGVITSHELRRLIWWTGITNYRYHS